MSDTKDKAVEVNETPVIKERKRWLFFGLPFTFTKYILDGKCLKLCKGFFTTTEDDLLLFRVMDVSLKRTLMQRIFRLGTMIVVSSDKTNPNLEVKNIKNVREFKEALNRRVESERLRMRFKAGEFIGSDFDDDNNDNT
ncbi:MAG: PH domain-containing protein [Eubacteriales bacterium]|mgnify:CR=1 FL=1|nr:PH domain-containing protein [Eubacteriales bacterium]MDD4422480.1 PH domain-containing protein [Eubacteriales bacterium]HBR31335.1 hypothetical protein [Clostridiales bacterium]